MCKINGEYVDHLFHCEVACTLSNAFSHFGMSWVMSSWVVNLFHYLLVDGWLLSECCHVEDGALLPLIVSVEEINDWNFEGPRVVIGGVQVLF
jgi:hypothetical protein